MLLLAGAALYVGFGAVGELSDALLASWGDALALTLASDVSAAVAQNGLAAGGVLDEEAARYTAGRLRLNEAGLRGVVGVALTDASGRPLALTWPPERPTPPGSLVSGNGNRDAPGERVWGVGGGVFGLSGGAHAAL